MSSRPRTDDGMTSGAASAGNDREPTRGTLQETSTIDGRGGIRGRFGHDVGLQSDVTRLLFYGTFFGVR